MNNLSRIAYLGIILALLFAYGAVADGDAVQGKTYFKNQCSVCHSLTANRVGPILSGVYGRRAGEVPGYNYSTAVKSSKVVWNATTLDKWLASTQDFIPGQKMNISISDPKKRADIIAYLKTISTPGSGE